jgi:hypothetical protein
MTPLAQLTLSLEPSLVDRWPTLRKFVAHRVEVQPKPAKTIAAEMDLSPSALSKKLNPGDTDSNRFNVDDLEAYLSSTGDVQSVIEYLATKYAPGGDKARKARALARLETLAATLEREITSLQDEKE